MQQLRYGSAIIGKIIQKPAVVADHVQNNALTIVEFARLSAQAVKDGFVATGKFIGEEAARSKLGKQTITGQTFKTVGTFFGEEIARFRLKEQTTTSKFIDFLGEEAARLSLGEQTYMGATS